VSAFLVKYYGTATGSAVSDALGTETTKPRHGLVTVVIDGEPYVIADVGFRMLTARERARAQGFPDSYVIERQADGTPVTKTDQGRLIGNAVPPQLAAAVIRANAPENIRRQSMEHAARATVNWGA